MSNLKLFLGAATKAVSPKRLQPAIAYTSTKQYSSEWVPKEVETHTGQKWEADDYRLARFVGRPKHVNKNFAINLIEECAPIASKSRVVWCDGGDPATGHPKVYINLDKPGNHSCGYCGLRYYLDHCDH